MPGLECTRSIPADGLNVAIAKENSRVAFIRQVGATILNMPAQPSPPGIGNVYAIALRALNRTQLSIKGDIRICQALRSRQQSLLHWACTSAFSRLIPAGVPTGSARSKSLAYRPSISRASRQNSRQTWPPWHPHALCDPSSAAQHKHPAIPHRPANAQYVIEQQLGTIIALVIKHALQVFERQFLLLPT